MKMAYTPRTTTPSKSNKYFYKNNPFEAAGYGLPNCTTYAWGRFYEVLGTKPKLSTSNAENWWNHKDGYERGQTPKLGAVICWRKGKAGYGADGAGHVAIVEKIYADGSILIGQSGWGASKVFWTQKLAPPYSYGGAYTLQGFIYNPAVKESEMTTKYKVGVYCGHGKSNNGSWDSGTVYNGKTEAELMLPITKKLVEHLKYNDFEVFTDADSNNINMIKQVERSNKNNVAVHVALHCDWYKAKSGSNPLYCKGSKNGKRLAECLDKYIEDYTGLKSKGATARTDLYELNKTKMPACVFECGSIKYDADEWDTSAEVNDYAKALAKGLCAYFGKTFKDKDKEVKEDKKTAVSSGKKPETTKTKKNYSGTFPKLPARGYLTKGDKGTQVENLQKFLNWAIGTKLEIDGSFGNMTLSAVETFQAKYDLVVDGKFGTKSLKKAKEIKK
jgi:N-acetylmuramoyl-L-alanine amidase